MATVKKSVTITKPAADVWDAVSDAGQLHTRVVPGMVSRLVAGQTIKQSMDWAKGELEGFTR